MIADLVIHRAAEVLTCAGPAPRCGRAQQEAGRLAGATIASSGGRIVFVGAAEQWSRVGRTAADAIAIDAASLAVVPGFVDPHTHLIYAGDRRDELRRRLAGATYADLAAEGGGILRTVRATRAADAGELRATARIRLDEMLRSGTTTCEVKSGYGLDTATELTMLRVARELAGAQPVEIVPTFLGAHEIPPEFEHRRREYLARLIDEMIPAVASEKLAEWCDVFCETDVFTPEESRAILGACRAAGLKARIHADELSASGGARVAVDVGARSADHLIHLAPEDAAAMARAGTVATLLPIAAFYLKLGRFAPARMLIDAGVPVALATDLNPGGGFSPSMPFAMALACFLMDMTFEEALVASTINAAYALDRQDRLGSLEVGKQLDAVLVESDAVDLLRVGAPAIRAVIKKGRVVSGTV